MKDAGTLGQGWSGSMTLKDTQVQVIKALGMDFEAMNPPFQQSGFALSIRNGRSRRREFHSVAIIQRKYNH